MSVSPGSYFVADRGGGGGDDGFVAVETGYRALGIVGRDDLYIVADRLIAHTERRGLGFHDKDELALLILTERGFRQDGFVGLALVADGEVEALSLGYVACHGDHDDLLLSLALRIAADLGHACLDVAEPPRVYDGAFRADLHLARLIGGHGNLAYVALVRDLDLCDLRTAGDGVARHIVDGNDLTGDGSGDERFLGGCLDLLDFLFQIRNLLDLILAGVLTLHIVLAFGGGVDLHLLFERGNVVLQFGDLALDLLRLLVVLGLRGLKILLDVFEDFVRGFLFVGIGLEVACKGLQQHLVVRDGPGAVHLLLERFILRLRLFVIGGDLSQFGIGVVVGFFCLLRFIGENIIA